MDRLHEYCLLWGLSINVNKTKIIIFTKNDPIVPLFFMCGDHFIEIVDEYKYLGIIFHKTGKFQLAEEHLAKQGNKAMHALRRNVHGREIKLDVMTQLFDSLVSPIITYGAEVWFPHNHQMRNDTTLSDQFTDYLSPNCPAENVHTKFCRSLLGVHKKAIKTPVLAELGRYPISLQMICQIISFWIHITEAKEDSLLKQAYEDMLMCDSHKRTWVNFVKSTLINIGFGHVWYNQCTLSSTRLKYSVSCKLKEKYIDLWQDTKNKFSRLSFYNKITNSYSLQPYLIKCKNPKHRVALCRLRLSAHDLEIERGRYHNIAANDRLCKSCTVREDEIHFLDHCSIYSGLRSNFLASVNKRINANAPDSRTGTQAPYKNPSSLLHLDSGQAELAKYIFECFESRKRHVHVPHLN